MSDAIYNVSQQFVLARATPDTPEERQKWRDIFLAPSEPEPFEVFVLDGGFVIRHRDDPEVSVAFDKEWLGPLIEALEYL